MQNRRKISLSKAISEIKNLSISFRAQNGDSSLRIPNKDFNLWMVQEMLNQRGRLDCVETRQKMILWFVPISIALIGLGLII